MPACRRAYGRSSQTVSRESPMGYELGVGPRRLPPAGRRGDPMAHHFPFWWAYHRYPQHSATHVQEIITENRGEPDS